MSRGFGARGKRGMWSATCGLPSGTGQGVIPALVCLGGTRGPTRVNESLTLDVWVVEGIRHKRLRHRLPHLGLQAQEVLLRTLPRTLP